MKERVVYVVSEDDQKENDEIRQNPLEISEIRLKRENVRKDKNIFCLPGRIICLTCMQEKLDLMYRLRDRVDLGELA